MNVSEIRMRYASSLYRGFIRTLLMVYFLIYSTLCLSDEQKTSTSSSASIGISLIIYPKLYSDIDTFVTIDSLTSLQNHTHKKIPLCIRSNTEALYSITIQNPEHKNKNDFRIKNKNLEYPYTVMLQSDRKSPWLPIKNKLTSHIFHAIQNNQSCDGSPQMMLELKQPISRTKTLTGAINLTINAI